MLKTQAIRFKRMLGIPPEKPLPGIVERAGELALKYMMLVYGRERTLTDDAAVVLLAAVAALSPKVLNDELKEIMKPDEVTAPAK